MCRTGDSVELDFHGSVDNGTSPKGGEVLEGVNGYVAMGAVRRSAQLAEFDSEAISAVEEYSRGVYNLVQTTQAGKMCLLYVAYVLSIMTNSRRCAFPSAIERAVTSHNRNEA